MQQELELALDSSSGISDKWVTELDMEIEEEKEVEEGLEEMEEGEVQEEEVEEAVSQALEEVAMEELQNISFDSEDKEDYKDDDKSQPPLMDITALANLQPEEMDVVVVKDVDKKLVKHKGIKRNKFKFL